MTVLRALSLAMLLAAPAAAAAAGIEIVNADFESGKPGIDGPHGWSTAQHTGPLSYDFALDSGEKKSGTQSLRITNIGPEPYGSLIQSIPATGLGGKKLRLTAWVKISGIPEEGKRTGAVLSLTALRGSAVLASEAMHLLRRIGPLARMDGRRTPPPGTSYRNRSAGARERPSPV